MESLVQTAEFRLSVCFEALAQTVQLTDLQNWGC